MQNYEIMKKNGFTLIEILISLAAVMLLGSIALVSFRASRNVRELSTGSQNIMQVLRRAQEQTLAGQNNSSWGVHVEPNKLVLFEGTDYGASTNKTDYPVSSLLEIANISLAGGGSDIVFKRVTGDTDNNGSFVIHVAADPSNSFSLTIAPSGKVYQTTSFPPPSVLRSVDMRHLSFNLGWSIKPAVTLRLTFSDPPNPNTVQDIAMVGFFNPGQTVFDWSGTYAIGGLDQALRIHTTALTDTDTVLSIDRDCRKNTKKLAISIIDIITKSIATYEANCATITLGAYGGTQIGP